MLRASDTHAILNPEAYLFTLPGRPGAGLVGRLDVAYDLPSQSLAINNLSLAATDGYDF